LGDTVRSAPLLSALLVAACACSAGELPRGTWRGGDTAAWSLYGFMKMTDTHITWGDPARGYAWCSRPYQVIAERPDAEYTDLVGKTHVISKLTDRKVVRIKFTTTECGPELSGFRFIFYPDAATGRIFDLIEYDLKGESVGWMHFNREEPKIKGRG
jgi:hypothetical protein